jgi:hypothetical protein
VSSSFALSWLVAFVFTQSVEMGIYVHAHDRERPRRERIAIAFACSAITHPIVWFVIPELARAAGLGGWWTAVAVGETFAVLAEAAFLACFGVRRALLWALAANGCSFVMGLFGYLELSW